MNIYEIDAKYQEVLSNIEAYSEDHEGIITDEMAVLLEKVSEDRNSKIENCIKYFKNEKAKADILEIEIQALERRMKSHRSHSDWMKKTLAQIVGPGNKPEYGCGKISWRSSKSVDITDSNDVPIEFSRIIPESKEPDKIEIKKALESGKTFSWAKLIESQNIQIK